MKCNCWIFLILLFWGCGQDSTPKQNPSSLGIETKLLASMIHPNERADSVFDEKQAVIEEKILETAEDSEVTKTVLSMVDEVPVAGEGEYIIEPPIDTSGFESLDAYYAKAFEGYSDYLTDGLDFPVGKPDGDGYYIAQKYLQNRHLGDDFNANTGGNTDLGDPVYAIGNGIVSFAYDLEGGWGNTVRIVHRHPVGEMVESLYSHLDELHVSFGQYVKRGDLIGTIGTAHGLYPAHLHLEIRTKVNMPLGRGYSDKPDGYTAPTPFIRQNRPRW